MSKHKINNMIDKVLKEKTKDKRLQRYIEKKVKLYLGEEIDTAHYDLSLESNISDCFKRFVELNKEVANNKQTDLQTVKSFLGNVYCGGTGGHNITRSDFVKYLNNKGITITDRRGEKDPSGLECVKEN